MCAKCTAFTTAKLAFSLKRVSRSQSRSLSYKIRSGDTFSAVSKNRVRGTSRAHGPGSSDPEARGRAPLARDVSLAVSGLAWGEPRGSDAAEAGAPCCCCYYHGDQRTMARKDQPGGEHVTDSEASCVRPVPRQQGLRPTAPRGTSGPPGSQTHRRRPGAEHPRAATTMKTAGFPERR